MPSCRTWAWSMTTPTGAFAPPTIPKDLSSRIVIRRRRLHPALCHRTNGRGPHRPLRVVNDALADRHSPGADVARDLKADPLVDRKSSDVQRDVAIDELETVRAGVREQIRD